MSGGIGERSTANENGIPAESNEAEFDAVPEVETEGIDRLREETYGSSAETLPLSNPADMQILPSVLLYGAGDTGRTDSPAAGSDRSEPVHDRSAPADDLNENEYVRLRLLSKGLTKELLQAARSNESARDVLGDITSDSPDLFSLNTPVERAMKFALKKFPEARERFTQAAIASYENQSYHEIIEVVADLANKDPEFARLLKKQVIEPWLFLNRNEERRQSIDLLIGISGQWTNSDLITTVENLEPNQLHYFIQALKNAPESVRQGFNRVLQELDPPRDPSLPEALRKSMPQAHDSLRARLRFIKNTMAASPQDLQLSSADMAAPPVSPEFKTRIPEGYTPTGATPFPPMSDNYRELFARAWPEESYYAFISQVKGDLGVDSRYLAVVLNVISDRSAGPETAEKLFSNLGLNTKNLGGKIKEAVDRYGLEELQAVERRLALYNSLDPELRRELTGQSEEMSAAAVAGVILNGKLGEKGTAGSFLLEDPPLETRLKRILRKAQASTDNQEGEVLREQGEYGQTLKDLKAYTEKGVGFLDMASHAADSIQEFYDPLANFRMSGVEAFEYNQKRLIQAHIVDDIELRQEIKKLASMQHKQRSLEFARDIHSYSQLAQAPGSQLRRDYIALAVLDKYGIETIKVAAPQVWKDLTEGGLKRLKDRGLIQSDRLHEFYGEPARQADDAMAVLANLKRSNAGNLDLPFRRKQALSVLDRHPAVVRAQEIGQKFGEKFAVMTSLFDSGKKGTKYEDYVQFVKNSAGELEQMLETVDTKDLRTLKEFENALAEAEVHAQDPETRLALDRRRQAIQGLRDLLDPASEQNKSIRKVLKSAQSRDLSADTLGNWLEENGPVIAAATVAVAVTVGSMGTASPLATILVTSAVSVGAMQATKEALYLINHHIADTGLGTYSDRSYMGAWVEKHMPAISKMMLQSGWEGTPEAAYELITSFATEVAGPLGLEYAQQVVIGLISVGALQVGRSGFSGLSKQWVKSLVRNPRSAAMLAQLESSTESSAARAFTRQWIKHLAKDSLKETAEEIPQEGLEEFAERSLKHAGADSPLSSMLVTVSMSLVQGRIGGSMARFNNVDSTSRLALHESVSSDVLQNLSNNGFHVEELGADSYRVSQHGKPESALIIDVTSDPSKLNEEIHLTSEVEHHENSDSPAPGKNKLDSDSPVDVRTDKNSDTSQDLHKNQTQGLDRFDSSPFFGRRKDRPAPTAENIREMSRELKEYAKEFGRKLGLPPEVIEELVIAADPNLRKGARGSYSSSKNEIRIAYHTLNPRYVLEHELRHFKDCIDRTAAQAANPRRYRKLVREQALAAIGSRSKRIVDGEAQDRPLYSSQESAAEMRDLMTDYLNRVKEPDCSDPDRAAIWLERRLKSPGKEPYRLLFEFGSPERLAREMATEAAHVSTVTRSSTIGLHRLKGAQIAYVDAKAGEIRRDAGRPASTLSTPEKIARAREAGPGPGNRKNQANQPESRNIEESPMVRKLLHGLSDAVVGRYDKVAYQFSTSEILARRIQYARELGRLLKNNGSTSAQSRSWTEIKLGVCQQQLLTSLEKAASSNDPATHFAEARRQALKILMLLPSTGRDCVKMFQFMHEAGLVSLKDATPELRSKLIKELGKSSSTSSTGMEKGKRAADADAADLVSDRSRKNFRPERTLSLWDRKAESALTGKSPELDRGLSELHAAVGKAMAGWDIDQMEKDITTIRFMQALLPPSALQKSTLLPDFSAKHLKELEKAINDFARSQGLPPVELFLNPNPEAYGSYGIGTGKMYLNIQVILNAMDTATLLKSGENSHSEILKEQLIEGALSGFIGTQAHELQHSEQDILVVSHLADKLNIGKTATPRQLDALVQTMAAEANCNQGQISRDWLKKILALRDGRVIQDPVQNQRAEGLLKSFRQMSGVTARLKSLEAKHAPVEEALESLMGIDVDGQQTGLSEQPDAIKSLEYLLGNNDGNLDPALSRLRLERIFGTRKDENGRSVADVPDRVQKVLNDAQAILAGESHKFTEEDVAEILYVELMKAHETHQKEYQRIYDSQPHETEAKSAGNGANTYAVESTSATRAGLAVAWTYIHQGTDVKHQDLVDASGRTDKSRVITLLEKALDTVRNPDQPGSWSEDRCRHFEALIEDYKNGKPEAIEKVHSALEFPAEFKEADKDADSEDFSDQDGDGDDYFSVEETIMRALNSEQHSQAQGFVEDLVEINPENLTAILRQLAESDSLAAGWAMRELLKSSRDAQNVEIVRRRWKNGDIVRLWQEGKIDSIGLLADIQAQNIDRNAPAALFKGLSDHPELRLRLCRELFAESITTGSGDENVFSSRAELPLDLWLEAVDCLARSGSTKDLNLLRDLSCCQDNSTVHHAREVLDRIWTTQEQSGEGELSISELLIGRMLKTFVYDLAGKQWPDSSRDAEILHDRYEQLEERREESASDAWLAVSEEIESNHPDMEGPFQFVADNWKNDQKMSELLQSSPEVLKIYQDQRMLEAETEAARQARDRALEPRAQLLLEHLTKLAKQLNQPVPTVQLVESLGNGEALGQYKSGTGDLQIAIGLLLNSDSPSPLAIAALVHEFAHLEQDTLMIRHLADQMGIGKAATPDQLKELERRYREETAYHTYGISTEFFEAVLRERNGKTLSSGEGKRAGRLLESTKDLRQASLMKESMHRRIRNLERALKFSGPDIPISVTLRGGVGRYVEQAKVLFGENNLPGDLERVLTELDARHSSSTQPASRDLSNVAKELITKHIRERLAVMIMMKHQIYAERFHEIEGHEVSDRIRFFSRGASTSPRS